MNRYVGKGDVDSGTEVPPNFDAFRDEALACGCDEALVREWGPDTLLETHTHAFDAEAIVVQGELWLSENGRIRHLTRGGTFRLRAGTPHAERYGPDGATYWVGRKRSNSAPSA